MCSTSGARGSDAKYGYEPSWPDCVRAASEALVRIGKPAAVPLAARLAEENLELYPYGSGTNIAAVIKTLGKIPEPAVLPVLLAVHSRASHDQKWGPEVSRYCREAMTAIEPNIEQIIVSVEADKKRLQARKKGLQASWLEKLKRKLR